MEGRGGCRKQMKLHASPKYCHVLSLQSSSNIFSVPLDLQQDHLYLAKHLWITQKNLHGVNVDTGISQPPKNIDPQDWSNRISDAHEKSVFNKFLLMWQFLKSGCKKMYLFTAFFILSERKIFPGGIQKWCVVGSSAPWWNLKSFWTICPSSTA